MDAREGGRNGSRCATWIYRREGTRLMSTACDLNRPKKFSSSVGRSSIISKLFFILPFFSSIFRWSKNNPYKRNVHILHPFPIHSTQELHCAIYIYIYILHAWGCIITRYILSSKERSRYWHGYKREEGKGETLETFEISAFPGDTS